MIKVDNIETWGFEHAIRGMRNPLNSWALSDSQWKFDREITTYGDNIDTNVFKFVIGEKDLNLMKRLYKAGSEHRKYLRQIFVSMDITAPLYWYKEWDTYKVGTVSNSCSTMHKIADHEFTRNDFSVEHLLDDEYLGSVYAAREDYSYDTTPSWIFDDLLSVLNASREKYLEEIDPERKKIYWWQMIQLLPSSYNQKRTITMNYENAVTILHQRSNHKLDEWRTFVNLLYWELPYLKDIVGEETPENDI